MKYHGTTMYMLTKLNNFYKNFPAGYLFGVLQRYTK